VLSAVLRRVESACDEILAWLDRRPGLLQRLRNDVSHRQAQQLRSLAARLRVEVARIQHQVTVDSSEQSRARAIAAVISSTRVEIEEVRTPGLRGYGSLPEDIEAALDARLARLLDCLETMSDVVETTAPRGTT
jgi:hypothetical protein